MVYIGIDLGGTSVKVGLVDENGKILVKESCPTLVERGAEPVINDMANLSLKVVEKAGYTLDDVKAIGIGIPGVQDPRTGRVPFCTNLGWHDVPLIELMQKVIEYCATERPDLVAYDENRELLYNSLIEMGYECAKPDGAFYLFVKAPNGDANAFSEKAKLEHNLLVVSADGFGCPGFFRCSYCVANDMIRRSLPAFKAMIESYK